MFVFCVEVSSTLLNITNVLVWNNNQRLLTSPIELMHVKNICIFVHLRETPFCMALLIPFSFGPIPPLLFWREKQVFLNVAYWWPRILHTVNFVMPGKCVSLLQDFAMKLSWIWMFFTVCSCTYTSISRYHTNTLCSLLHVLLLIRGSKPSRPRGSTQGVKSLLRLEGEVNLQDWLEHTWV